MADGNRHSSGHRNDTAKSGRVPLVQHKRADLNKILASEPEGNFKVVGDGKSSGFRIDGVCVKLPHLTITEKPTDPRTFNRQINLTFTTPPWVNEQKQIKDVKVVSMLALKPDVTVEKLYAACNEIFRRKMEKEGVIIYRTPVPANMAYIQFKTETDRINFVKKYNYCDTCAPTGFHPDDSYGLKISYAYFRESGNFLVPPYCAIEKAAELLQLHRQLSYYESYTLPAEYYVFVKEQMYHKYFSIPDPLNDPKPSTPGDKGRDDDQRRVRRERDRDRDRDRYRVDNRSYSHNDRNHRTRRTRSRSSERDRRRYRGSSEETCRSRHRQSDSRNWRRHSPVRQRHYDRSPIRRRATPTPKVVNPDHLLPIGERLKRIVAIQKSTRNDAKSNILKPVFSNVPPDFTKYKPIPLKEFLDKNLLLPVNNFPVNQQHENVPALPPADPAAAEFHNLMALALEALTDRVCKAAQSQFKSTFNRNARLAIMAIFENERRERELNPPQRPVKVKPPAALPLTSLKLSEIGPIPKRLSDLGPIPKIGAPKKISDLGPIPKKPMNIPVSTSMVSMSEYDERPTTSKASEPKRAEIPKPKQKEQTSKVRPVTNKEPSPEPEVEPARPLKIVSSDSENDENTRRETNAQKVRTKLESLNRKVTRLEKKIKDEQDKSERKGLRKKLKQLKSEIDENETALKTLERRRRIKIMSESSEDQDDEQKRAEEARLEAEKAAQLKEQKAARKAAKKAARLEAANAAQLEAEREAALIAEEKRKFEENEIRRRASEERRRKEAIELHRKRKEEKELKRAEEAERRKRLVEERAQKKHEAAERKKAEELARKKKQTEDAAKKKPKKSKPKSSESSDDSDDDVYDDDNEDENKPVRIIAKPKRTAKRTVSSSSSSSMSSGTSYAYSFGGIGGTGSDSSESEYEPFKRPAKAQTTGAGRKRSAPTASEKTKGKKRGPSSPKKAKVERPPPPPAVPKPKPEVPEIWDPTEETIWQYNLSIDDLKPYVKPTGSMLSPKFWRKLTPPNDEIPPRDFFVIPDLIPKPGTGAKMRYSKRTPLEEYVNTMLICKEPMDEEEIMYMEMATRRTKALGELPFAFAVEWRPPAYEPDPEQFPEPVEKNNLLEHYVDPEFTLLAPISAGAIRVAGLLRYSRLEKVALRRLIVKPRLTLTDDDRQLVKNIQEEYRTENTLMRKLKTTGLADCSFLTSNALTSRPTCVTFAPSRIHDWGLYTMEDIRAKSMIIEYIGEICRSTVVDNREARYIENGIGSSYLFRINDDWVIDATRMGNCARFINHSCTPNSYARVVKGKHIAIYSKRFIEAGEEITYDYKFPLEDKKIPCFCNAHNCRGSLN